MNRLPPILARDYRRNVIWPRLLAGAASVSIAFILLIVAGFARGEDYVQKSAVGMLDAFVVTREGNRLEYVVHLDDAEIERIRNACR